MTEQDNEQREYVVWATVKLRGAWMNVTAGSMQEAKDIADKHPDFDMSGAEMTDWEVTGVEVE